MATHGGDEVSALVLDIGSHTTRAGYAGDDSPKAVFSTSYGYVPHRPPPEAMDETGANGELIRQPRASTTTYLGEQGPNVWRPNMVVTNPFSEGILTDFAPIPHIVKYAIVDSLRCDPTEHPVLVTEPTWNTKANRERMAEIMFEDLQVPAFYIANSGVLNAFAAGKGTALVIDVGKSMASVVPVVDGFVLRKGCANSTIPLLVRAQAYSMLTQPTPHREGISLLPHHLISNKQAVDPGLPPRFTYREDRASQTTDTWRTWAEHRELDEWLANVSAVMDGGWNEQIAQTRPVKQYEFPTGYNTFFGADRFLPGEVYFNNSHMAAPDLPAPLNSLLNTSLGACEPDLRAQLLSNVVLTGGSSLLSGFSERIVNELTRSYPNQRIKLHAAGNITERRYGAWLGGSVLASLGTFHQLWISKEEWQEHGKSIVGQRCK
ncbi:brg1-associated factor b [Sistotremastrum niveocremeum HHB9708]|uniref:Brg1-associated factor b n=2 Tax=Sistotremastraceae TaxID=3402574 RepID=A0A164ZSD7_9AGAM|nr:brg1-associated factor b [Sistotremastrum niveocremeum HHB9708]KZT33734.1 actin-related protein Arp4p [Sistotremastrum suecicum HHB10207 ss-3]